MAEKTTSLESLEREAAADRLNDIANALRDGDDFTVAVGNKNITLNPAETVNFHIAVTEKQRRFRGNRESIKIELDWKPE
jgi:amphi-Trp domain-containing protein